MTDHDCANGLACDGNETCVDGACQPGVPLDCEDENPCTVDFCSEDAGGCVHDPLDHDDDGYIARRAPDNSSCGGTDCNDQDEGIFPGAPESCEDGVDADCSGTSDRDDDEDGHVDFRCDGGDDCDDQNPDAYAGAPPGCGTIEDENNDLNCDGLPDGDRDEDGHAPPSCDGDDCNDDNAFVHAGHVEVDCDGLDNNCDGYFSAVEDFDHDGFASIECGGDDCDDRNFTVHPGAEEAPCDGLDNDCDGSFHPDEDADHDGYAASNCGGDDCDDSNENAHPGADEQECNGMDDNCDGILHPSEDGDEDGQASLACGGDDCDDTDPFTFSGADEVRCDGKDNNCDGYFDPNEDADRDGYASLECGGDDCNDLNRFINPGADEAPCNGKDDDCDGLLHPTEDGDGDGFANPACGGYDCDDARNDVFPGASEEGCDAVDNDCDGDAIEGIADEDDDDFMSQACGGDDCDDSDPLINPAAEEICDELDNNCDGLLETYSISGASLPVALWPHMAMQYNYFDVAWTGSRFAVLWAGGACDAGSSVDGVCLGLMEPGTVGGVDIYGISDIVKEYPGPYPLDIIWTGSVLGAVWNSNVYPNQIFTVVDEDGTRLSDNLVMDVALPSSFLAFPSLAWTGSEFAVAWSGDDTSGISQIWFSKISADGSSYSSPIAITSSTVGAEFSSLTWSGSSFGLTWLDGAILFMPLTVDGLPSSTAITISSEGGFKPSIQFIDPGFMGGYYNGDFTLFFLSADGTDLTFYHYPFYFGSLDGWHSLPTWSGQVAGVLHSSSATPYYVPLLMSRLSKNGSVIQSDILANDDWGDDPDWSMAHKMAVWTGSEYGVFFEKCTGDDYARWNIFYTRLTCTPP